jgi:hypothetical protein
VNIEIEKQCSCCKQVKLKSLFYKNKGTRDGFDNYCKECRLGKYVKAEPSRSYLGKSLKLEDFHPEDRKWKRVDTWNKYDADRLDELLHNGGNITEVFFMDTKKKAEWDKNKKLKRSWKKKDK